MPEKRLESVLVQLRQAIGAPSVEELTDEQLLQRFTLHQEEAAFAALVRRHGPMVLGVCRRVVKDAHAAEDAFQATFMVLARKASAIRKQESVGSWLHGVALRVAGKARAVAHRRFALERQAMDMRRSTEQDPGVQSELEEALDQELRKLPEKFRAPLVLCYLEGKTNEEAARELGWTPGAVRGCLFRGRDMLRNRLLRRGVGTASALLLAATIAETATAAVPPALFDSTVKTAMMFAAGKAASAGVAAAQSTVLAEKVLRTMVVDQLKVPALVLVFIGMAGLVTVVAAVSLDHPPELPAERVPNVSLRVEGPNREDALVETDVLKAMKAPEPFFAELVQRIERAGGMVRAEVVLRDQQGLPASNVTVIFSWAGGEEILRTDDQGRASLQLNSTNLRGLRVHSPAGYAVAVAPRNDQGLSFDFGEIGAGPTGLAALERIENQGIEVAFPRGREATAQQALNDLVAMRIFTMEQAGLELKLPCRIALYDGTAAHPDLLGSVLNALPLAEFQPAMDGTPTGQARTGRWLVLRDWVVNTLQGGSATQNRAQASDPVCLGLAEVLACKFCSEIYPRTACAMLSQHRAELERLRRQGGASVDFQGRLEPGSNQVSSAAEQNALAFLYWQEAAGKASGEEMKKVAEWCSQTVGRQPAERWSQLQRSLGKELPGKVSLVPALDNLTSLIATCESAGR